ncbi:MAG: PCI domain-containing protein [Promethearchaeia archaeon]
MTKCLFCDSQKVVFTCERCKSNFCINHIATTEEWICKKHNITYNRNEAKDNGYKCNILEESICPECENLLRLDKYSSGQYFLKCSKCTWNSSEKAPSIISPIKDQVLREAMRFNLIKEFKICNKKLKHIPGKEICPKCFLDLLKRDSITNISTINNFFHISTEQSIKLINKFIDEKRIDGIIERENGLFYYIAPEIKEKIRSKFEDEGVIILEDLAMMLDVNRKVAHKILLLLINLYKIKGKFAHDISKFYTEDYLKEQFVKYINQKGRVKLSDISKHFDLALNLVKDLCVHLMRNNELQAYFGDRANQIITTKQIYNEINEYAKKYGIFRLTDLANNLKIALELARRMLHEMIKSGKIQGIFTQKREFITKEYLEEKLKEFARAYEKISLRTIAERIGITIGTVEDQLAQMISQGKILGKIDSQNKILITKDVPVVPVYPTQQVEGLKNFQARDGVEVVREYDFVGGQLHFKVVVRNKTNMAIHSVKVLLDPPSSFKLKQPLITIPVIEPGNSRGVDFYLEPKECGISSIGGTVIYKDASGEQHTLYIRKKEVQIKCPLVCSSMSTIEDCQLAIQSLPNDARAFLIADLDPRLAYRAAIRTMKHFDTSMITTYEGGEVSKKEYEAEAWFCSEAKVTGGRIITRIYVSAANQTLEVRVWCNNPGQLTGFLAKIIELLFDEINIIRKIKAEEREKTIDVMAITQNLAEISDYCMLRWKAQNIRLKLHDTFVRLKRLIGSDNPILGRIEFWLTQLNKYGNEDNISEEDADKLVNDVEKFKDVLHRHLII